MGYGGKVQSREAGRQEGHGMHLHGRVIHTQVLGKPQLGDQLDVLPKRREELEQVLVRVRREVVRLGIALGADGGDGGAVGVQESHLSEKGLAAEDCKHL